MEADGELRGARGAPRAWPRVSSSWKRNIAERERDFPQDPSAFLSASLQVCSFGLHPLLVAKSLLPIGWLSLTNRDVEGAEKRTPQLCSKVSLLGNPSDPHRG